MNIVSFGAGFDGVSNSTEGLGMLETTPPSEFKRKPW